MLPTRSFPPRVASACFLLAFLLPLLLAFLLGTPASADILVVPAAEDSAPYSFLPSLPRGTSPTLYAFQSDDESGTAHDFETFLWFDVEPADIPVEHVLVEATLVVTYAFDFTGFGDGSNAPGTLECRQVLGPWDSDTLTWSNRPAVDAPFDTISDITSFGAQLCDATAVVLDWLGGRMPNEGIALVNPSERVMGMNSIEAAVDPSLMPQLILRTELPEPGLSIALASGAIGLAFAKRRRAVGSAGQTPGRTRAAGRRFDVGI